MTRLGTILRTARFRAAIVFLLLFLVLTGIGLAGLFERSTRLIVEAADKTVWREAAMAEMAFDKGGRVALMVHLDTRLAAPDAPVFRLSSNLGQFLGGNLSAFPAPDTTRRNAQDWLIFSTGEGLPIRARLFKFSQDDVLLVGYDSSDIKTQATNLQRQFLVTYISLAFLGLLGGLVMASQTVRRVAQFDQELRRVAAGDLQTRLKLSGSGDAWDDLTAQINTMLHRVETLVQEMRQVTDNLAHDLRRPLTRVRVRLETMHEKLQAGTATDFTNNIANDSAKALSDIDEVLNSFAALLTLSRLESGAADIDRAPVDLADLLEDVAALYAPVFEAASRTLLVTPHNAAHPITALGDRNLLARALSNLLENALAHGAGAVALSLCENRQDRQARFGVADGGTGIAPDLRDMARKRFMRLEASRATQGNGLGLALVEAIARAHHGRLALGDASALHGAGDAPTGLLAEIILPLAEPK